VKKNKKIIFLVKKETILNREEYYKYDVRINRNTNKFKELSLFFLPKELMQNMIFKSI